MIPLLRQFKEVEDVIERSSIPCTFVRSNFYMENLYLQDFSKGLLLPLFGGRWAPIAVQDVAKCIVGIVQEPEPHMNKAYDLTGPELLYGEDIADIASRCLGRKIPFYDCQPEEFYELLVSQGVQHWLANGMADFFHCIGDSRVL